VIGPGPVGRVAEGDDQTPPAYDVCHTACDRSDLGQAMRRVSGGTPAEFWDRVARDNAAWHVATGHTVADSAFFAQGAMETDAYLTFCGVAVRPDDTVLEIGCGVGRMTHRLAELAARVIATDVSQEMLDRAAKNLIETRSVDYVLVAGDGSLPVPDASVDLVFSYITLQHVPSRDAQLRYLHESLRVLRTGGALATQVRAAGVLARAHDWAGHTAHFIRGRPTLHPAWRGATLRPTDILTISDQLQIRRFNVRHSWVVAHAAGIGASS
jgi:SAM-dependent methyltransferase